MFSNKSEEELVTLIEYHNNRYWNLNDTEISDEQFDLLVKTLKNKNPNHTYFNKIQGISAKGKIKVKLRNTMLSLDKVYSKEELSKWCQKIARDENEIFIFSPKYDGLSADYYNDGTLVTRGDGGYGIDITDKKYLIKVVTQYETIPLLQFGYRKEIRGEILISKSTFKNQVQPNLKRKDGQSFKNTRNAVPGIIARDDKLELDFQPLLLVSYDYITIERSLQELIDTNFSIINGMENQIIGSSFDFPVDGIVIKLKDEEYGKSLGETSHHEKYHIAFKFENPKAESKLLDIIWQVGKRKVTPVGKISPVTINGSTIQNVTLHNYKYILDRDIQIGDKLIIERAGDVIPHIVSSEPGINRREIQIHFCPSCESLLLYEEPDLICNNPDCEDMIARRLYGSVVTLGIENLGLATVENMVNYLNVKTIIDLLFLDRDDIITLPGFAEVSANNLYREIQKVRNKPIEEYKLLAALNIEGIGKGVSKKLLEEFTLEEFLSIEEEQLSYLPQIGPERANKLYEGLIENRGIIQELRRIFKVKSDIQETKGIVCFTGKLPQPEKIYKAILEEKGWVVKDSVSKDLTYLVTEDINTNSGKGKRARELGIRIITTEELMKIIGEENV